METNPRQSKMMQVFAWFVLSTLLAMLTLNSPLDLGSAEQSSERATVGDVLESGAEGTDLLPTVAGALQPPLQQPVDGAAYASPRVRRHFVYSSSSVLRYAPKQSPPYTS